MKSAKHLSCHLFVLLKLVSVSVGWHAAGWQMSIWVGSPKKGPQVTKSQRFPTYLSKISGLVGAFVGGTNPSGELTQLGRRLGIHEIYLHRGWGGQGLSKKTRNNDF